jgi:peptidoglycan lytic transglycosylase
MQWKYSGILLLIVLLAGCGGNSVRNSEFSSRSVQKGLASYYHDSLHGNTTANGEIYDRQALSAAHKTLPFGTEVLVTNLANGRSLRLRINDRGPFVRGRIIDVSRRAAERLDFVREGVVEVRVEVVGGGH